MKMSAAPNLPTLDRRTLSFDAKPSRQSTFRRPAIRPFAQPILHSAIPTLHSPNPYCTAVFCTVPRNEIFSEYYLASPRSLCRRLNGPLSSRMLTLALQGPSNPLYPGSLTQTHHRSSAFRFTTFHRKLPVIAQIASDFTSALSRTSAGNFPIAPQPFFASLDSCFLLHYVAVSLRRRVAHRQNVDR